MAASYNFKALFGGIRCGLKVRFYFKVRGQGWGQGGMVIVG